MNNWKENLINNLVYFKEFVMSLFSKCKSLVKLFKSICFIFKKKVKSLFSIIKLDSLKSIITGIFIYIIVGSSVLDRITPLLGLVVIVALWILLMTLFCNSEVFILKYIFILFGLFIALIINRISKIDNFNSKLLWYKVNFFPKIAIDKSFEYYIVHLIFLLVIVVICYRTMNKRDLKNSTDYNDTEKLYVNRIPAFKRFENAIKEYNGIGINGEFGIGKTVFIKNYIKEHSENIYIFISLVSINVDNVEAYILKQLRQVLLNNRIYDNSIDVIIAHFEKWKLANIFNDSMSYCDMFEGIKKSLKLINNKKIVFIIDDLDRVVNKEIIIKIFNIFELLCGENDKNNCLKSIYLYDINNLIDIMYGNQVNSDNRYKFISKFKKLIHKYVHMEIPLLPPCGTDFNIDSDNYYKIITIIDNINSFYKRYGNSDLGEHNFNYYCNYNPRTIERILNDYIILYKCGKIDINIEKVYFEALIFKFFFYKEYKLYLNRNCSLDVFLKRLRVNFNYEPSPESLKFENEKTYLKYKYWLIYCIFEENREYLNKNNINEIIYNHGSGVIDKVLREVE